MARLTRAERFKDARTVHNQHGKQTMDKVAAATGITKSVIHALEDDNEEKERNVGYKTVAVLAKHYGVSADWLLELSEDHRRQPSAVDELGISAKAVEQIKAISAHDLAVEMLESLNMIMGDPYLSKLLLEVNMVAEAVRNEIAHLQSRASKVIENPLGGLGLLGILLDDQMTSREIENEIIAAHPELAGRITIECGEYSLERRIDELGSSFTTLIRFATGYHELDSLRKRRE